ncbi:putative pentatricopeptide repeat-containing protein At3g01580 [Selaginella moellendorffii]|uniref:putative pentatricopeptide repeat-containing protein At3g01580 n=1 Tax=Selaginella moellendorffii TaxID=88036 RepID=UPI000D1C5250|nr:putative pentatricopeptide repeat-containing protein At3g01580 [Selaginella moellendorffii]|eukprot:XP_024539813.1 putative pentatricopeptide repeat-containing protein At3g01580 [Selaginella moellendorffii]
MRAFRKFSFRTHSQENARGLVKVEECKWNEFFQNPSAWWDHRKIKSDPKEPDFVHAKTKDCLWITSFFSPPWLPQELKMIRPATSDARKSLRARYKSDEEIESCQSVEKNTQEQADSEYDPARIRQHRYALKGCSSVDQVQKIHLELSRTREARHVEVAKTLIALYSKFGAMVEARKIFEKLAEPTQGSWNAMVRGFSDVGEKELSLEFFDRMIKAGVVPDARIFVRAFKACGDLAAREEGKVVQGKVVKESSLKRAISLHKLAEKCGQESNIFVANAVLDLYAKCGSMAIARKVFERMAFQDPVSWNSMIMGYVQNGDSDVALELFSRMQDEEFTPDSRTFLAAITACSALAARERSPVSSKVTKKLATILERGQKIHEQLQKTRFQGDVYVANAMIDMYAKCGSMAEARSVFDGIHRKTLVSWNSILTGYALNGEGSETIKLFEAMKDEPLEPSARTYVALLGACSSLAAREEGKRQQGRIVKVAALAKGRAFHEMIRERELGDNVFVANALVDMYSKCGSLEEAREVFDGCRKRDVAIWNAMISACAQLGDPRMALDLFAQMEQQGDNQMRPSARSYAAALAACSAGASIEQEGKEQMAKNRKEFLEQGRMIHSRLLARGGGFERDAVVSSCILEMYAKFGAMSDARKIFEGIGERDCWHWRWIVAGYSRAGNHSTALKLFRRMEGEGFAPDAETLVAALDACRGLEDLESARRIHAEIVKAGLEKHQTVKEFFAKNTGYLPGRSVDSH